MADEFRQGPGLLPEPLRAVGEIVRPSARHNGDRAPLHPGRHLAGHVFLNGHLGLELGIESQIGDAEAALAQDAADDVAVVEHRPRPKGHRELLAVFR